MPPLTAWSLGRALAVTRVGLGLATLLNIVEAHGTLIVIAEGGLATPQWAWVPEPSPWSVWVVTAGGIVAAIGIILRFRLKAAVLASTLLNAWILTWDVQTYTNHHFLTLLLVFWLAFIDDGPASPGSRRPLTTIWAPVLMMSQLSVCYLFAGLSKMNGGFLTGRAFDSWLRWDLPDVVTGSMALGTIVTELFLAVGLWFTWSRPLAAALGAGLHASIVVSMEQETLPLVSFSLACLVIYPLFFAVLGPADDEIARRPVSRGVNLRSGDGRDHP